jgi:hypothetical protein
MVKAALLYADHAKLCSIVSATLLAIVALGDTPKENRWELFKTLNSWAPDEENEMMLNFLTPIYEQIQREKHTPQGAILLRQFEAALAEGWADAMEYANTFVREAGGDGIVRAVDSGLLEVHTFESTLRRVVQPEEHRNYVLEYVGVVSETVSNAHTYPLFDEDTSQIISAGITAGLIPVTDSAIARGKETGLAADVLARLPLFDLATVKEVLDIRRELERPLKRFRSAMINFSESIKTASWDENFPSDADQVFRREVEPAVLNIEEEVQSNKFIAELVRKAVDKPIILAGGSALALAVTTLQLPALAALAVGGLVGGGSALYDAYKEWSNKAREIEQNQLFFYYRAGKFLSNGTYEYVSDKA